MVVPVSTDPQTPDAAEAEASLFEGVAGFEHIPDPAARRKKKPPEAPPRTQDARGATAHEILAEWVRHIRAQGITETNLPDEIMMRVGRSLKSVIRKGYTYDEIVNAMRIWTIKDLRNRKSLPRTSMIEVYARQYRGETTSEAEANQNEHERLRTEALMQGQAPSVGTRRQRDRDASMLAIFGRESRTTPRPVDHLEQ